MQQFTALSNVLFGFLRSIPIAFPSLSLQPNSVCMPRVFGKTKACVKSHIKADSAARCWIYPKPAAAKREKNQSKAPREKLNKTAVSVW